MISAHGLEKSRTLGGGRGAKGEDVSKIDRRPLHSNAALVSYFFVLYESCCSISESEYII